jgi:GTP-binding protein
VVSYFEFKNIKIKKYSKISIIGRPNVGKSSLLNAILNEERSIVSSIENTTRDSVNSDIKIKNENFTLYDTAGINKKSKLIDSINHYALSRAINSIENSEITLLLIDPNKELVHFDSVVASYSHKNNKPLIIVVNK